MNKNLSNLPKKLTTLKNKKKLIQVENDKYFWTKISNIIQSPIKIWNILPFTNEVIKIVWENFLVDWKNIQYIETESWKTLFIDSVGYNEVSLIIEWTKDTITWIWWINIYLDEKLIMVVINNKTKFVNPIKIKIKEELD